MPDPKGRDMSLFLIALKQIIELFLMMGFGYLCRKSGAVDGTARKQLTTVLMNVVMPCVILDSFLSEESSSFGSFVFEGILLLIAIYLISILASMILIRKNSGTFQIERLSVIFSNAGFLGIPLLSALYGELGRFCAILAMIAFNVVFWTYGAFLLTEGKTSLKDTLRQLMTPPLISVAAAVVMLLLSVRLPSVIAEPVASVAAMNSPFAMIVTGITLAESDLTKLFSLRVIVACLHKNIIIPIIAGGVFFAAGLLDEVGISLLTTAACPTAAMVPMVSIQYGHDAQIPSGIFTLSTLMSLITLPLYVYMLSRLASL